MRTRLTIVACLWACNLVSAAETNTPSLIEFANLTGGVLRKETSFSEVAKLPSASEITNVVIGSGMRRSESGPLTEAEFRNLLDHAKPKKSDARVIFVYHYVPWYKVAFDTKAGRFYADLNLGIGFLLYPDDRIVAFEFQYPVEKEAANKDGPVNASYAAQERQQAFSFTRVALSAGQRRQLDVAVAIMKLSKNGDTRCESLEDAAALLWRSINMAIVDPPAAVEYRGVFLFSRLDWAKNDDKTFSSGFAVQKGTGKIYRCEEEKPQAGASNGRQPIRSETNSIAPAAGSCRWPLRQKLNSNCQM